MFVFLHCDGCNGGICGFSADTQFCVGILMVVEMTEFAFSARTRNYFGAF